MRAALWLLGEGGCSVAQEARGGWTPLHAACAVRNNESMVELLITRGAPTNARNDDGNAPIHYFCKVRKTSFVLFCFFSLLFFFTADTRLC